MDSVSSPFLPPELELEVFETTADLYPESIPNLLLVSHRVHEWIERIKYKTITPGGGLSTCRIHVLQQAIRSNSKPPAFFRDRVQHLFIEDLDDNELNEILPLCSGVRFLVLFQATIPSLLPSLSAMRPCRLNLYLKQLLGGNDTPPVSHPVFTSVTHLDLFDTWTLNDDLIVYLALFPVLTHLAVWHSETMSPDLPEVLARCTNLEALIDMYGFQPKPDRDPMRSIDDARFVVMVLLDDAYEKDWVIGTRGGSDFWARAEMFIAKKRRGEIEPRLSYLCRTPYFNSNLS
ncbi:hypothetical protein B0H19DRAFT_1140926 [Mycena capillaripes]|nr:hypothetical protein B0H19DRAFT_1140926 [Mycena capillaripes]